MGVLFVFNISDIQFSFNINVSIKLIALLFIMKSHYLTMVHDVVDGILESRKCFIYISGSLILYIYISCMIIHNLSSLCTLIKATLLSNFILQH